MFSKIALFVATAFALGVVAAPGGTPPAGQCNTGTLNCCNSVQNADSPAVQSVLAGLVGVVVGDVTAQVGLTCNPISVIGLGGNSCSSQAACCTGNSFSGLITLACTPINLNA